MALILSIDDHPATQEMIIKIIKKLHHIVITATNGTDGLDIARNANPDIIFLDLNLPDMNGFKILDLLRKNSSTKNIPIIIVSATSKKEDIIEAMKQNVVGYITKKNFKLDILKEKIGNALAIREKIKPEDVVIKQQTGKTIFLFNGHINNNTIEILSSKLDRKFLTSILEDVKIFDFRYLYNFNEEDITALNRIISLIPNKEKYIIAGKHFGTIMLEEDFDENIHLFISYEDMDNYIFNSDLL
jgi:twitching motility two-component system response regulator PilH